MAGPRSLLPPCGLYRTTVAHPRQPARVGTPRLVFFHNHSPAGPPEVLLPARNVHNRWHFDDAGVAIDDLAWVDTLASVPAEGFFSLRRELGFEGGSWPKNALVQLGYTRSAEPILFIAQLRARPLENDLFFSGQGVKVGLEKLALLEPLSVFVEDEPPPHEPLARDDGG